MSLIYRLTAEMGAREICFGPDGLRFYSLDYTGCSVWEPYCLLNLAGAVPDSESLGNMETAVDGRWPDTLHLSRPARRWQAAPPISALEPAWRTHGSLVAHETSDGCVDVCDTVSKRKRGIDRSSTGCVAIFAWNAKHDLLAYPNSFLGSTTVRSISVDRTTETKISTELVYTDRGLILKTFG
jgi:hypothetical protein